MVTKKTFSAIIFLCVVLTVTLLVSYQLYTHSAQKPVSENPIPETPIAVSVAQPHHTSSTIGYSVENRPLVMHEFGSGSSTILFVGGIHGGYEWNSVVLAEKFIEHFSVIENVPSTTHIAVIPNLNPDGVALVTTATGELPPAAEPSGEIQRQARFNANGVDLNRNFDCKWQAKSMWRGSEVSAGNAAFSEPEARALRTAVATLQPDAVVFWHSQANAVYASECEYGILPNTMTLMNTYANAANYPAVATFDAYPITGDAEGWLASIGIPAITVELSSHQSVDWEKNLKGVTAILAVTSW